MIVCRELRLADMPEVLLQAGKLTGIVMLVLGMASAFSFALVFERIPHQIAQFIAGYTSNWIVFVICVPQITLLVPHLLGY